LITHSHVFKAFVHLGEERCLIPSWTVFLTGCSLRCAFCSERAFVLDPGLGRPLEEAIGEAEIRAARASGARNLHFVGGEPLINLPGISAFLKDHAAALAGLPVLLNTNLYATPQVVEQALALGARLLPDLKFGNRECAEHLCGAPDYLEQVLPNLARAVSAGAVPLVRHLAIPGHWECCTRPVLELLARWPDLPVNLMTAYLPLGAMARWPASAPERHVPTRAERIELISKTREIRPRNLLVDGD
jgi:putative pyruvate formate lyase activating enzyme